MKLHNVTRTNTDDYKKISLECQQFLEESGGLPLLKYCSTEYPNLHKVKVRKRKHRDNIKFNELFNRVFSVEYPSIRSRSIIINDDYKNILDEMFYVFPIDGFKFLYSPNIKNSKNQYGTTLTEMQNMMKNEATSESMFRDLIQYNYQQVDLEKAILDKVEIIIYNIPYFYVVRANVPYKQLLECM